MKLRFILNIVCKLRSTEGKQLVPSHLAGMIDQDESQVSASPCCSLQPTHPSLQNSETISSEPHDPMSAETLTPVGRGSGMFFTASFVVRQETKLT
jgi:hypothetical protein